jgi:hypothetical protein
VDIEGIQIIADKDALLLTLLVERSLDVDEGISAAGACAGMTKNVKIHRCLSRTG